ncbi:MAG: hypothetical protein ACJ77A_05350 [Actinomycetota bacterium]
MAARAHQLLDEDIMLARYVERAERHERARVESAANPDGTSDLLLARYLRNLQRQPRPEGPSLEHSDVRTCAHCGAHEEFLTTRGSWAECPACGHMA